MIYDLASCTIAVIAPPPS